MHPVLVAAGRSSKDGSVSVGVFLLDDHELVRTGLRSLLESTDDLVVVGEAGTAAEALSRIPPIAPRRGVARRAPARRERRGGLSRNPVARPETACIMLTSYADDEALFAAIMAGAAGYVLKQVSGTDLVDDVRRVGRRRVAARPGR